MFETYRRMCGSKGINWLVPIATGLIGVAAGVALLYLLPEYLLTVLNDTALFAAATTTEAQTAIDSIQALGFFVVVISMIWLVIGVISASKGGN